MTATLVLTRPPFEQRGITLLGRSDGPVQLRREVVEPPFDEPAPRVREEHVVGVEPANGFRKSGPPDAERTDAELHPRLGGLDADIERLDQQVHVATAPVVAIQRSSA